MSLEEMFPGTISGRVTYADGTPAKGFVVRPSNHYPIMMESGKKIVTDDNGYYRVPGVSLTDVFVSVDSGGKPFVVSPMRRITLKKNAPIADGVDFTLTPSPYVTVRVRNAETGKPIPGFVVAATPYINPETPGIGATDKQGQFRFRTDSQSFNVYLRPPGPQYPPRFTPAPGYSFQKEFRLERIKNLTWEVLAYTASETYPGAAAFRGRVVGVDGRPVAGATVRFYRYSRQETTTTDPAGRFSFQTQRMTTFEEDENRVLLQAVAGDRTGLLVPRAADTWGEMTLRLDNYSPSLTGTVVGTDGKPLENVRITVQEHYPGTRISGTIGWDDRYMTDATGRFTLPGLSPFAVYKLTFGGTNNIGKLELPAAPSNRDWLQLKPGERRDLGTIVIPKADGAVAGRLLDPYGNPVTYDVLVRIKGAHTDVSVTPDTEGRFRAEPVVREPLTMRVFWGRDSSYNHTDESPDIAALLNVRAGQEPLTISLPERPSPDQIGKPRTR
jgi:hypothetical protein